VWWQLYPVFLWLSWIEYAQYFSGFKKDYSQNAQNFWQEDKQCQKQRAAACGLLNGFMPCGPLQAMQLYALGTGSFIAGATSMFMFSLGTVPLMFGLGAISSIAGGKLRKR